MAKAPRVGKIVEELACAVQFSARSNASTGRGRQPGSFDDTQILLFTLHEGRVRVVDHFVGDPTAVTAFWA